MCVDDGLDVLQVRFCLPLLPLQDLVHTMKMIMWMPSKLVGLLGEKLRIVLSLWPVR